MKKEILENMTVISKIVAERYGVKEIELHTKCRKEEYRLPRQISWAIMKDIYGNYAGIGVIGGYYDKKHSTAIHGIKTVKNILETEKVFNKKYAELLNECRACVRPIQRIKKQRKTKRGNLISDLKEILKYKEIRNIKIKLRSIIAEM